MQFHARNRFHTWLNVAIKEVCQFTKTPLTGLFTPVFIVLKCCLFFELL